MARPPRFDSDQILDAAVRLAAASGPGGVTMSAVAQEVGAPSGSVYHRFSGRPALLAEVWLRTVERFQEGWFSAVDGDPDPRRAARAAARHVVSWSRAHPQEASLLLHGPEEFGRSEWSEEHRARADAGNARAFAALRGLGTALGAAGAVDRERVALAVIDLPLSLVRRHLRADDAMPAYAEQLAEECADGLIEVGPKP
ncbi:TetR/AcrR family transcriptional regulator [Streptomyces sp. NPDC058746]|uniref:TetR/AcrR family transcriptional regulator n=1 Tax=Streptomyces sp. NPDC058746 TaxID=3346622 RepID=UPI0036CADCDB